MENMNIGLIGLGHMGAAFWKRFHEAQSQGLLKDWQLKAGTRENNTDVAAWADLLVATVKPGQIEEMLGQIRGQVRRGTGLLSFAGAVPVQFLEKHFDGAVGRGMADLGFEQAIRYGGDERMKYLLDALSIDDCLETQDEIDVDRHTTLVACNPGISAWQFLHNAVAAREWLASHNDFTHEVLGVHKTAMERLQARVLEEGDLDAKIKAVATPGGVTESMVKALEAAHGRVDCRELYGVGMGRIQEVGARFLL